MRWWFESTQRDQWPCSPIRQRQQVESLSSGGSNPPVVTIAARGAIGRRGTFRPCRSGFESPRADHPSTWFESHRWDHSEGDIVEGKDAALSAREYGFESRCPRQDGLVVQGQDPWSAPRRRGFDPLRVHQTRPSASRVRGLPWGWSGLITRVPMGFESPPRDHSGFVQRQDGGPTNRSRGFDSLTRYQLPWPHAREAPRAWPWCKRQHGRSWPSWSRFKSGRSPQLRVVG